MKNSEETLFLQHNLTICIPTNYVKSSPGISLIKESLSTLILMYPEIQYCNIIISYDQHKTDKESAQYLENLQSLSEEYHNLEVVTTMSKNKLDGQPKSFINMTSLVKTPYLLFFEHDWIFKKTVDFYKIINTMIDNPFVDFVSFNKRQNIKKKADYILQPETRISEISLLKSSRYSNNPHIATLAFWHIKIPKILKGNNQGKGSHPIESVIFPYYSNLIKKIGFDEAHEQMGIYLYGEMNDPSILTHLDGKKFK